MPFLARTQFVCVHRNAWLSAQAEVIELSQTKCLQMGVFSFSVSFSCFEFIRLLCQHPVTDACSRRRGLFFFYLFICFFSFVMGQHGHGYKCTSNICLRICRGHCSHSSEVSVCRGPGAPSLSHQCGLSHTYLPVKSFIPLITGQWLYQQNASGVFSTCFLHRLYGLLYR